MYYQDIKHFQGLCGYVIKDIWYPRVTKILEVKAKPALEKFFKEVESYERAADIKQKSAEEGSLLHETIEALVMGKGTPVPRGIEPAITAFEKFRKDRGILFHPEFVELRLWSLRHRYAGTVDALTTVDGKFGVLDIKTSTGFYPEFNLQTAAYLSALQELEVKRALALPRDIETRWILRVDQKRVCARCGASLREKGGRKKVRNSRTAAGTECPAAEHQWGETAGEVEIREFPYSYKDMRAFVAAKILWEWENEFWLKKIGYVEE